MTPERWLQIKTLLQATSERDQQDRERFLLAACEGDPELREQVESLLSADGELENFLENPAFDTATAVSESSWNEATVHRRIGSYEILRKIGHGGMGVVYLAAREEMEYRKEVAIKVIPRGLDTEFVLRRFRNERRILAGLQHPFIAALFDGGTTEDGLPYFVMEYVKGEEILRYCDGSRLPVRTRLDLFLKVCAAVQYAHQNLVVHRDIKPGNILVTEDGDPKLLDFGIAKLLGPDPEGAGLTSLSLRAMTPEYASPEQVRGERITTASDVYSLGVLLYELLTGHSPYRQDGRGPDSITHAVCEEEPQRPSSVLTRTGKTPDGAAEAEVVSAARGTTPAGLRRELRGDIDNIVLKAMQKEPARRYASVEQLSEDIHRHLSGRPVRARPDTIWYRSGKFIRRNKTAAIAGCLLIVSLVTGLITTAWQARVARQERARAEHRFDDVRKLANSFLFEFHDAIKDLPGSTPARALVVKKALEYLDSLTRESGNDASLRRELATAYEKVGDVRGDPYSASLGDTPGALATHRKSLAVREALVAAYPANAEIRHELASSHLKIGDILWVTGDWKGALDAYQKAREINESLAAAAPADGQLRYDLSLNYLAIGDTLAEMGDLEGALASHRRALAIREELAAASAEVKTRLGVAVSHVKVADMLTRGGKMAECLKEYEKGVGILEALVETDPANAQLRRYLMNSSQRLGEALMKYGENARALEVFRKNLATGESLAAADPADAVAQRNLAGCYSSLAAALSREGDYQQSLAMQRKGLEIVLALSAADPANAQAHRDVLVFYEEIADLLVESNHLPEAAKNYRNALEMAEELAATSPASSQARSDVADLYFGLARIDAKNGDFDGSLELQRQAFAIREGLANESPMNADFRSALAKSCFDLGKTHTALGVAMKGAADERAERWRQARAWYQKSLETLLDLRARGLPAGTSAENVDEVAAEIARCDEALAKLNAPAPR